MSNAFRLLSMLAAFFVAAGPAHANEKWMLVQAVGEVSVAAPGTQPVAAKPSTPLPDGATVRTGPSGRAVLLRGRETIVMSPSSALTLPAGASRDFTKVRQQSGTLLFKIGKKPEAHFEVDTPYLAAVVKGTTFTVKVASAVASVHVLEGAVEVATADRKRSFLTRAGQISSVFAKAAGDIFTTGASVLNGPSGGSELWGTSVSDYEFGGGQSGWSAPAQTRTYNNTGLTAAKPKTDTAKAPSGGASERAAKDTYAATGFAKPHAQAPTQKDKPAKSVQKDDHAARDYAAKPNSAQSAPKAERKASAPAKSTPKGAAAKPSNLWTVTQAMGDIKIDGASFASLGEGKATTLPPGTKVETGANGRLGVVHGAQSYVIDANTVAFLADPDTDSTPQVVSGAALQYSESSGRYEAVENMSADEVAALRAEGRLDNGTGGGGGDGGGLSLTGGSSGGRSVSSAPVDVPRLNSNAPRTGTKTEEVRTKVIGGLTLGLYSLTALLVLAFGAQWIWRRYRSKPKEAQAESLAQARLRSIKEA
jgi:hypothetical protein